MKKRLKPLQGTGKVRLAQSTLKKNELYLKELQLSFHETVLPFPGHIYFKLRICHTLK